MGTPQTTVENVRVALCVHKHPPQCGLLYFHSVGDIVRGVLQTRMFSWLHKLPVCLVSRLKQGFWTAELQRN